MVTGRGPPSTLRAGGPRLPVEKCPSAGIPATRPGTQSGLEGAAANRALKKNPLPTECGTSAIGFLRPFGTVRSGSGGLRISTREFGTEQHELGGVIDPDASAGFLVERTVSHKA